MKQGKKPTRAEKQIMKEHRLNADNWLVNKHTPTEMVISHKHGATVKTIRLGV